MSCGVDSTRGGFITKQPVLINLLADVQLVESKVSAYNLWQKDSVSSLLYYQLSKKYQMSQDSINLIIQQSLKDPIQSQHIYELVSQRLDSINSSMK